MRDTRYYILIAGVWERRDAFVSASIVGGISRLFSDSFIGAFDIAALSADGF